MTLFVYILFLVIVYTPARRCRKDVCRDVGRSRSSRIGKSTIAGAVKGEREDDARNRVRSGRRIGLYSCGYTELFRAKLIIRGALKA